jgi:hemerythrin-like domain-containing protein
MCNYCGCRDFPEIGELSAEHVEIEETAGLLRRAVDAGDDTTARRLLSQLTELLMPHVTREETGLFAALSDEVTMRDTLAELCAEHGDLHAVLCPPSGEDPDWPAVLAALERLHHHIDKEEHGVFPAAVVLLPMPAWDRIATAG